MKKLILFIIIFFLLLLSFPLSIFGQSDNTEKSSEVKVESSQEEVIWEKRAKMPTPRAWAPAVVEGGKIYVVGGASCLFGCQQFYNAVATLEVYDPAVNSWKSLAPMSMPRVGPAVAALNGKIYVFGGFNRSTWSANNTVEIYDIATNTWTRGAPMPTPRSWARAVVLNDKIYVIGGVGYGYRRNVDIYDPSTNTWTTGTPILPRERYLHAAVAYNGKIYVIGGDSYDSGYNEIWDDIQEYDPATNTWTKKAPMPAPASYLDAVVVNGKIYVFGALPKKGVIWVYDIASDQWGEIPSNHTYDGSLSVAYWNNFIYRFGGGGWGPTLDIVEATSVKMLEVSATILNKEELINALTKLKETMLKKIDNDINITAIAFTDVKAYWRSKRWADLVRAPLRILEDTLALPLKVKDFIELQKEVDEEIRIEGSLYQVLSLVMMLNDLQEIGGKLNTAISGPKYTDAVTKMLRTADTTYTFSFRSEWEEHYRNVIVYYLQGIKEEKPLVIPHRTTATGRKIIGVAYGATEVKRNISNGFDDLINMIKGSRLPYNFPLGKIVNWLKELEKEIIRSKQENTDIEYDLLINEKKWHTNMKIGTVGELYKKFGKFAHILGKYLEIEQKVELFKAGEAVICTIRYKTIGAIEEDLGTLQLVVNFGEILLKSQKESLSFMSDPETEFYMIPQEMLMFLPNELSNIWMIADDVNQQIRAYLQTQKESP